MAKASGTERMGTKNGHWRCLKRSLQLSQGQWEAAPRGLSRNDIISRYGPDKNLKGHLFPRR